MKKYWKAILGVILIFILGWVSGVITTSLTFRHKVLAVLQGGPAAIAQVFEKRMTRNLGLDDVQKQKVHDAFVKNLNQRMELQKTIQPQVLTLNQQTLSEINTVLKPDQQKKFLENINQFRRRFGKNPLNPVPETPAAK